jgi:hypothetical protein
MHRVRAIAPGYVTKSSSVAFNANVTLDFSLERVPPPPPPPARQNPARPAARVVQQARATSPPRTTESPRTADAHPPDAPRAETVAPRPADPPAPTTPPAVPGMVDPQGGKVPTRAIERKDPYSPGGGP